MRSLYHITAHALCTLPPHPSPPTVSQALLPAAGTERGLLFFSHLVDKPLPTHHLLPLPPTGVLDGGSHRPLTVQRQAFCLGIFSCDPTACLLVVAGRFTGLGGLGSYPSLCRWCSRGEALPGEVGCGMDHRCKSQKTSSHPNCVVTSLCERG